MENSLTYKWVAALFFSIVGVMFTASVFYLAAGNVAPDTYWGRKMTLSPSGTSSPELSSSKHVLELNNGVTIGNRIFYYRGRQGDTLRFQVIIPELDRQYPYPLKVDLSQSKNGFEMAGIWFQLIAARSNFVSLKSKL